MASQEVSPTVSLMLEQASAAALEEDEDRCGGVTVPAQEGGVCTTKSSQDDDGISVPIIRSWGTGLEIALHERLEGPFHSSLGFRFGGACLWCRCRCWLRRRTVVSRSG